MTRLLKVNLFLLMIILLFSVGCKKEENINYFESDTKAIEVEIGSNTTISFESDVASELVFKMLDSNLAEVKVEDKVININALNIGKTKLEISYQDKKETIDIEIIDKVLYLPIPTGRLLLKGVDKDASVKVIVTKDGLDLNDINWVIEDPEIARIEAQGGIIKIHSLKRGNTVITVKLGEYSNSFTLYVTNIRGDID